MINIIFDFIKRHYKGFLAGAGIIGLMLYVRGCTKAQEEIKNSPLPPNVVARITVDPTRHHLRIQQRSGKPVDTFLSDHPSTFEITSSGQVKVSSPQFGFEHKFFFGLTVSDNLRVGAGLDGFYFKKLDLGLGVADRVGSYTPVVFVKASYLVYDNLQLGITFDNMQHVGAALTLRI